MATYTVGPSGDYATLALAIAGVGAGNTIQILTAYVHDGSAVSITTSGVAYESESGNPADCVLDASASTAFMFSSMRTGMSFTGITFKSTKASSSRNCVYINKSTAMFTDCVFEMSGTGGSAYAAIYPGLNCLFQRCTFKGNNAPTRGIYASHDYDYAVDSCFFDRCGSYAIYMTKGNVTVRNCTIYTLQVAATTRGIWISGATCDNSHVYNCILFGGAGVSEGVKMYDLATNSVKNVISFGSWSSEFDVGTSTVTANLYDQAAVTADGNPVFTTRSGDLVTDFHPDTSGLAYEGGDASFAPSTDIEGESWNSPPSIGCYETPAAGGGGGLTRTVKAPALGINNPFSLDL